MFRKDALATQMGNDAFKLCDEPLDPIKAKIAAGMLSVALRLGLPAIKLLEYLSDETQTQLVPSYDILLYFLFNICCNVLIFIVFKI